MISTTLALLLLALSPADARTQPLGSTVTIEGFVTVPSATFASFMNNDQGFALADKRGPGIYISFPENKSFHEGQRVSARGTLADDGHGLLILRATSVQPLRGRHRIAPRALPLDQVNESTEGLLVTVEAPLARPPQSDLPYGYKLFLRHPGSPNLELQIFLPAQLTPNPAWPPGRTLRITGFVAQYNRTYELIPRSPRDIRPR